MATPELSIVCTDENVLFPDYIFDGLAGKGAFSVVKKAMNTRTGCLVAVKMISLQILQRNKVAEDQVEREITIMRKLMNPYVIQLYDVVYTPSHVCLIMEYASKGDFFDYVASRKSLEEDEARPFFRQLIAGLEYCHGKMVAHRDLKLENLLLDENLNLKITDFGLSAFMNDSSLMNESCGSPPYAAPEVLSGEQYNGPEVDVWSCGVILFAVLCGYYPFEDDDPVFLYTKIKSGIFESPEHLSFHAHELIKGMLNVNPEKRFTISMICKHPWLQV